MRQWLDQRGMHGEHQAEQVGETDTTRPRDEAQQMAVAIEALWTAVLNDLKSRLVMPV